jgi:hypothetical protein
MFFVCAYVFPSLASRWLAGWLVGIARFIVPILLVYTHDETRERKSPRKNLICHAPLRKFVMDYDLTISVEMTWAWQNNPKELQCHGLYLCRTRGLLL